MAAIAIRQVEAPQPKIQGRQPRFLTEEMRSQAPASLCNNDLVLNNLPGLHELDRRGFSSTSHQRHSATAPKATPTMI